MSSVESMFRRVVRGECAMDLDESGAVMAMGRGCEVLMVLVERAPRIIRPSLSS